jgi:hypothetical protein
MARAQIDVELRPATLDDAEKVAGLDPVLELHRELGA